jgi:hypothetical protein
MCILAGCDYLESLPGVGPKKALKLRQSYHRLDDLLDWLRVTGLKKSNGNVRSPAGYCEAFYRARMTFLHQTVYDDTKRETRPLLPLPPSYVASPPRATTSTTSNTRSRSLASPPPPSSSLEPIVSPLHRTDSNGTNSNGSRKRVTSLFFSGTTNSGTNNGDDVTLVENTDMPISKRARTNSNTRINASPSPSSSLSSQPTQVIDLIESDNDDVEEIDVPPPSFSSTPRRTSSMSAIGAVIVANDVVTTPMLPKPALVPSSPNAPNNTTSNDDIEEFKDDDSSTTLQLADDSNDTTLGDGIYRIRVRSSIIAIDDLSFLGKKLDADIAVELANGRIDPRTLKLYEPLDGPPVNLDMLKPKIGGRRYQSDYMTSSYNNGGRTSSRESKVMHLSFSKHICWPGINVCCAAWRTEPTNRSRDPLGT